MTALLQAVGFSSLGPLLLQDLGVIQNLQAWDLTDDVLSKEAKATRKRGVDETYSIHTTWSERLDLDKRTYILNFQRQPSISSLKSCP